MSRGWLVLLYCVLGAVIGQLVSSALAPQIALLAKYLELGFAPTKVDLSFMVVTLGIQLKLSIGGAVGLVAALWLALRKA